MTFISAYHERGRDRVLVWERSNGKRRVVEKDSPYYFYAPAADGDFTSIDNRKLKKYTFGNKQEFEDACMTFPVRFESDLNPLEKVMMEYAGKESPEMVIGFVDIEVDYDPKIGFSSCKNPYAPINALTLYRSDLKSYFTLAVPPRNGSGVLPQEMLDDNYFICATERELFEQFFALLDDVDVLSGWNSEFFDLPYIGKRIELLFGVHALRRLAFERGVTPRWTEHERFKGAKEKDIALDLLSRVHLDYMRLFKKFNLGGRQSYSLAAIADDELEIPKLHYDGSLADLYNNDFKHFCLYNRRDVEILVQLDEKFKYIELANSMVHEATVNFSAIFGSVQLIDTAIINFAHLKLNRIVFDRQHKPGTKVEGALVLTPKTGLHRWVASCDINSLYPSTYRSLNLSPEKIVGQLQEYEEGWKLVYTATTHPDEDSLNKVVHLQLEGTSRDEVIEIQVGDLITLLKEKKFAISAYGTILDQSEGEGLLAAVLSFWFTDRKRLQAEKKRFAKEADARLKAANGDKKDAEYLELKKQSDYFDMLQGVKKVLLNSSYGATLNAFCRFHDPRLGASTTGSGRQITTFMIETIVEQLIGRKIKLKKTVSYDKDGEAENEYTIDLPPGIGPVMSDTDSCYFLMDALVNEADTAIELADAIVEFVNASFPQFMRTAFYCQPEFDDKIKAVREIVAETGIIRAKKNYVFLVRDNEGKRYTEDTLKLQGGDMKISSTPEVIRTFLKDLTMKILKGVPKAEISNDVIKFRESFKGAASSNPLDFASVSSVKTYDEKYAQWERVEKAGMGRVDLASHVRGAINFNESVKMYAPTESLILGGSKVKVLWLRDNAHDFKNMAFPSEMNELPEWFKKHFEVDLEQTEQKLVDSKVGNTFHPIGWEVPTMKTVKLNSLVNFDD